VIVDQEKLHAMRRAVICRRRDSTSELALNHLPQADGKIGVSHRYIWRFLRATAWPAEG